MDPKNEVAVVQTTAVARVDEPMSVQQLVGHVHLIETVMKQVMQKDVHYGVVPGTDKPTLLLPGAQKLALTFRFRPDFEERQVDLEGGHREYHFVCRLAGPDGSFLGTGVGSCSSLEKKYRYRGGNDIITDRQIPKTYWDIRKSDPKKAQELLGGKGFKAVKNPDNGFWYIAERGTPAENPDLADTYNTVKKMAKKRAFVDAVLTVTGASDMFTQDVEDLVEAPVVVRESKSTSPGVSVTHDGIIPDIPTPVTPVASAKHRTKLQEARLGAVRALKTTTDAQEMARAISEWRGNAKLTNDEYNELMAEMERVTEDKDVPF
jgi:hypothetical protein